MFNHHKRKMKAYRTYKKRNFNKAQKETIGGTGTLLFPGSMYGIAPLHQYTIDHNLPVIRLGRDIERKYKDKKYLLRDNVPREWQTHDRTRWNRNKQKTKQRNYDRSCKRK